MEDQAVFSVLAQCFGPLERKEWEALTAPALWDGFLTAARRLLQDERPLGAEVPSSASLASRRPLQEFLSEKELTALFAPPAFEDMERFAARHFTGGLPASAMPVESLYRPWSLDGATALPQEHGCYGGQSARYVADLCQRLGLEVPAAFAAYPDHLALELDLMAVLLRSGMAAEARTFLMERFAWLTDYRQRLIALGDASFPIALVDVILGIRTQQEEVAAALPQGAEATRPQRPVTNVRQ